MPPPEWIGAAGLVTAVFGGIAGVIAAIARRRSDAETAEDMAARRVQEERAALTSEYRGLLDELRLHGAAQDRRHQEELAGLAARIDRLGAELASTQERHDACETQLSEVTSRLRIAEAKIAELGA